MKFFTIILVLFITSCSTKDYNPNSGKYLSTTDTVAVSYKQFSLYSEEPSEVFKYKLIKIKYGDSLLSFRYTKDTILKQQYDFDIKQGNFKLIQDTTDYKYLIPVDTFSIQLLGEKLIIYKYERMLPPVDGEIGIFFNPKYGRLGYSSYSWGKRGFLINFGNQNIGEKLKPVLLNDSSVKYLKTPGLSPSYPEVEDSILLYSSFPNI